MRRHVLAHAAEQDPGDARDAPVSDHDEVHAVADGHGHDGRLRTTHRHLPDRHDPRGHRGPHRRLELRRARLLGIQRPLHVVATEHRHHVQEPQLGSGGRRDPRRERGGRHRPLRPVDAADDALRERPRGLARDHQRPGANDNASGCVAILEVARALSKLIREGTIARPARTLRFIWPPEIEGTLALVNSRPDLIRRIKAVIHMDMVGGGPETKAIFHITRSPASLPSFVNDVAEAIGEFVNEQTEAFASTGSAAFPLHAPEGGKEPLRAEFAEFSLGSDHQVYTDSSIGIPAIYLNDWPDRYIHTNFDSPANIDPTKLKRAAFIGATSGYFLANVTAADAPTLLTVLQAHSLRRTATMLKRRSELPGDEAARLTRFHLWYERAVIDSMGRFFPIPADVRAKAESFLTMLANLLRDATPLPPPAQEGRIVYRRTSLIRGPLTAFGYDYLSDRLGEDRVRSLRLLRFQGLRGSGSEYAYETLNFVDGRRTAEDIRDAISAIYGPIPLELVLEYLRALSEIGVIEAVR